jgi:fumarate reductase flavoprotein subunit
MSADLVVVGAGGAGLAAALAAAESGCGNIVVLEKMAAPGGNTALGGGLFAVESPLHEAQGIATSRDDAYASATQWARWKNDPRIVRAYVDKSGDTVRWLSEKGLDFRLHVLYPEQSPPVWHMTSGVELIKALRRDCERAGIRLLTHTSATRLLTNDEGLVTGVVAVSRGTPLTITGTCTVLATGGFGGSPALLKRFVPRYKESVAYVGRARNVGEGLTMAEEVGAAVDDEVALLFEGPSTPISSKHWLVTDPPRDVPGVVGAIFRSLANLAKLRSVVWLNKAGRRFTSESAYPIDMACGNQILRQPDGICFAVFDDKIRESIENRGLVGSIGANMGTVRVPELRKQLEGFQRMGAARIADSWEGIAEWIGADASVLSGEIDEYNAACDRGYDPVLLKDKRYLLPLRTPPFYSIRCHTLLMDTLGGIRIDEKMRVLDRRGRPIPGLFAAGVCAGGLQGDSYNYDLPGSAQGFAVNSGRIAGENASGYVADVRAKESRLRE